MSNRQVLVRVGAAIAVLLLVAVVVSALAGDSRSPSNHPVTQQPAAVHLSAAECRSLQNQFDAAGARHDAYSARSDLNGMEAASADMKRLDAQMERGGCYD